MALLVSCRQCCCCPLRTGVQVLVVFELFMTTLRLVHVYRSWAGTVWWFGFFPAVLLAMNELFNESVYAYAAFVVFGSDDRIRGMKPQMNLVRLLWLATIVTDFFVAFPVMWVWHNDFGSIIHAVRELTLVLVHCAEELGFFCFVDSLNDIVQAGGTGMENMYAKQILAAKIGEPTEVTPFAMQYGANQYMSGEPTEKVPGQEMWYQEDQAAWDHQAMEDHVWPNQEYQELSPPANPNEKRICPDDGKSYTFQEMNEAFGKDYSAQELMAYWHTCRGEEGWAGQEMADQAWAGQAMPDQIATGEAVADPTTGQAAPDQTMWGQAGSVQETTWQAVPDQAMQGQVMSDQAAPGQAAPNK